MQLTSEKLNKRPKDGFFNFTNANLFFVFAKSFAPHAVMLPMTGHTKSYPIRCIAKILMAFIRPLYLPMVGRLKTTLRAFCRMAEMTTYPYMERFISYFFRNPSPQGVIRANSKLRVAVATSLSKISYVYTTIKALKTVFSTPPRIVVWATHFQRLNGVPAFRRTQFHFPILRPRNLKFNRTFFAPKGSVELLTTINTAF